MSGTTRLDRWLAPRIASRVNDTMRKIADNPTDVSWFRGNVEIAKITVLITSAPSSQFSTIRGTASQQTQVQVTVLAAPNTAFRNSDRLQAPDNHVYRIIGVAPDRTIGTEATAETV